MSEQGKVVVQPPQNALFAVMEPAFRVGLATGAAGFLLGGTVGIVKGGPPLIYATASAAHSVALGTTFWATRSLILRAWTLPQQELSPGDFTKASTISGGITGIVVSVLRGRSNPLPGAVMFSIFGFVAQTTSNRILARNADVDVRPQTGFWKRMSEKAWSPVTVMGDEEYAELLRRKLMRLDVEIAILDDRIAAVKKEQQTYEAEKARTESPAE